MAYQIKYHKCNGISISFNPSVRMDTAIRRLIYEKAKLVDQPVLHTKPSMVKITL